MHIARTDVTARELRAAAKSKDARAYRRISAIGLVLDGVDRKLAAESCGKLRKVAEWIGRPCDIGVMGARNSVRWTEFGPQRAKPRVTTPKVCRVCRTAACLDHRAV